MMTELQMSKKNLKIDRIYVSECEYCLKKFKNSGSLEKHSCESKKKHELLQTAKGKTAYSYYVTWMRLRGFKEPPIDTFLESRYFKSFIKFCEFAKRKAIPDIELYMKFLQSQQILPNLWYNDEFYISFIENFDNICPPEEQAKITVETLFKLAEIFQCEVCEVFDEILPMDLARLLRARKLSMWVLAFSRKFRAYCDVRPNKEEKIILGNIANIGRFKLQMQKYPDKVKKMQTYVRELGI